MKLTDKQMEILDKYEVNYKSIDNIDDFLVELFDKMQDYLDKDDNPTKEYLELEKVYYEIYYKISKDTK